MAIGDWFEVPGCTDLYYVDVGAYGIPEYGTVYVVDAERPAVVDTGLGRNREYVYDLLDHLEIDPEYVVPTHVHLDHAGGAGYLAERYPDSTVLTPKRGVEHLVDPSRLVAGTKAAVEDQWKYYDEPVPVAEDRIRALEGGDEIHLGDRTLHVHHAPGHAPHHCFLHDDGDDVVFTADAAGIYVPETGTVRPTSPPAQFHLEKSLADADAIAAIDPEVLCYGHFGSRPFHDGLMDEYPVFFFPLVLNAYLLVLLLLGDRAGSTPVRLLSTVGTVIAIDLVLDPGAVALTFWTYEGGGAFYGVPLSNYAGWVLSATVAVLAFDLSFDRPALTERLRDTEFMLDDLVSFVVLWGSINAFFGNWLPVLVAAALGAGLLYTDRFDFTVGGTVPGLGRWG